MVTETFLYRLCNAQQNAVTPPRRQQCMTPFLITELDSPNPTFVNGAFLTDDLQLIELGTACGRLFRCGVMVVLDAGDSDILSEQV